MPKKGQFYYAVRNGRQKGVFLTWPECESQVKGYPRPVYKKFSTEQEAWAFVNNDPNGEITLSGSGAFGVSCHSVGKALQGRKRKQGSDPVEDQRAQRFCPDPNGVTKWMDGWIKKGWKLSDGQAVKNKEDFLELLKAAEGLRVKWVHVRGHSGVPGNEQADRLAVAALDLPLPPG
ncbi:hypothetical protein HPB52_003040 [Rhipicephalus sanguineus]|uniref:ribonuclease H n=1 Tax=Rhipicephalus sanguineus TaxID=34632 RepID=A0A9D4QE68_RHISA|nr:hypothetical protein HPB52_003040 [Rhipicephalus sanguineus]